ncbi:MAG: hypothetical protein B7Z80_08620 [Rhodospirillales bacterium 20-64-7]|nr:MAG: hypothetical protein B7Z80_08620 [Rhodospirillales bacterium 20-64-7]
MSDTNRSGSVVSFPSGDSVQQHQPYNGQPEVRLSPRISPVAAAILALPFLYWLATIAFTSAGMQRFMAGLAGHIQWLVGSSDGNRVGSFTMLGLGIVAVIGVFRATIIRNYGLGAFGWIELLLGVGMLCGALGEWHLNQIGLLLMLGIVWGAYILMVWGWQNIRNDQGPTYAPQFQAQALPEQTIYGAARNAFDEEIHEALRDRVPLSNPGYRYRE